MIPVSPTLGGDEIIFDKIDYDAITDYLVKERSFSEDRIQSTLNRLKKALEKNPGDPWVLSHLVALTDEPLYKMKLFRYFDEIDAEFFLGKAYLTTGRFQDAVESFSFVAT